MRLHTLVCVCSSDSDALFQQDSSPTYCLTAVMGFCLCTKAILGLCDMNVLADACWVDKTKLLTISAHLQALTRREQGHSWVRLSYRHIFICGANPELQAKLCFFFFSFLHHHASGFQVGFLFPVVTECRLWAKEQYSVQRARKKLHVAIPTAYYARELLITPVFEKVCLPPSL